jgi:TetR/AcrR family transcriptional repressor of mexJK operon
MQDKAAPAPSPASRKDRKRADIIAIAQALFFAEGYAQTSMSQIAQAVGGSKATLYNHFQSKEELLLAVVAHVTEVRPGDYDEATQPPIEAIRPWLMWFGTSLVRKITSPDYVALHRLAAAEALRYPEIGRSFHEAITPGVEMISGTFGEAMAKGVIRRTDPALAAEHFMTLCLGSKVRRLVWNIEPPPNLAQINEIVAAAVSTFMDGYAPKP